MILLGDWISEVVDKAGIMESKEEKPYFINIPNASKYFTPIQSAVEWGIIDTKQAINPEQSLTREWAAYILMRLANKVEKNISLKCKDAAKVQFPDEVSSALSFGLMSLDKYDRFLPNLEVDKNQASLWLEKMVSYINNKEIDTSNYDVELDPIFKEAKDVEVISYDSNKKEMKLPNDILIEKMDILHFDSNGEEIYFKVSELDKKESINVVRGTELNPSNFIREIDVKDSFEIDFSNAEIEDFNSNFQIHEEISTIKPMYLSRLKERNFEYKGFHVSYKVQKQGISAEIKKENSNGLKVYAKADLINVIPSFQWKMKNGNIEEGYFKVDFRTSESLGIKRGKVLDYHLNLKDIDIDSLISIAKQMIRGEDIQSDINIPLCKIKVPIPQAPMISIVAQVMLHLSADGRAEILFTQDHTVGMEIRNNKIRIIHNHKRNHKNVMQASAEMSTGIQFALHCSPFELANIGLFSGVKATMDTILHVYDKNNSMTTTKIDLPADYVDELINKNPNILMCTDLKAYLEAYLELNSGSCIASRLGLHQNISILNESNNLLFPSANIHMENFHFVKECTRKSRNQNKNNVLTNKANLLKMESYSLLLNPGEKQQLILKEFPEGYSFNNLVFQVQNEDIISVNNTGLITAKNIGNTILKIYTEDRQYYANCHIQVRKL